MKKIKQSLLLATIISTSLFAIPNYCKLNNFIKVNDNSRKNILRMIVKSTPEMQKLSDLANTIVYNEPYKFNNIKEYIEIIKKNDLIITSEILKPLESATLFHIEDKTLNLIKNFYIENFEEIREIYKEEKTKDRFYTLKYLNIFSEDDLKEYGKNIKKISSKGTMSIVAIRENKEIKVKEPRINCSSRSDVFKFEKKLTALSASNLYLLGKKNIYFKNLLLGTIQNKELYSVLKYIDTKNPEILYIILKNNNNFNDFNLKLLLNISDYAFNKEQDVYKTWFYAKKFLESIKILTPKNIKDIVKAKNLLIISGEDISLKYKSNKDLKNYLYIKKTTIRLSKEIFKTAKPKKEFNDKKSSKKA